MVSLLTLAGLAAGCLGGTGPVSPDPQIFKPVALEDVVIEGADAVAQTASGSVVATWSGSIQGDLSFRITVPPEAVAMRLRYNVGGSGERGLFVSENQTGATRCFSTQSLAEEDRQATRWTCTGLTVLDTEGKHPAQYRVTIRGNLRQNSADVQSQTSPPAPFDLLLELLPGPLAGPIGDLDLSVLPPIQYFLAPQTQHYVPASSDSARLFVEVNLPSGTGPFPTILISSPYNQEARDAGLLTQGIRVRDWVPRGYAVVVADVRGFANSEGCVEVWGPREQQDQYDLVEWVAAQPWSNGKVAMYGQSYVGTTPHEAAILKAPHLVAIATVAGLTDPYFDWHFGGVPNGESVTSPIGYSVTTDQRPRNPESPEHVPDWVALARTQGCGLPQLIAEANEPNAVYGPYYAARNFTKRAAEIQVPVLYTQGYIDTNVKVAQATGFFDAIPTQKIGVFGPWFHRHPPRGDFDVLLHAWMARWLLDAPTNVEGFPSQAITNVDTVRNVTSWPPKEGTPTALYLDGRTQSLDPAQPTMVWQGQFQSGAGVIGAAPGVVAANMPPGVDPLALEVPGTLSFRTDPLGKRVYVAGIIRLEVTMKVDGADNVHLEARLFDVASDGTVVPVTFGMINGGLRHSFERFEPMPRGQDVRLSVELLPTEWVFEPEHRILLLVGQARAATSATPPGQVTITTGQSPGTRLVVPILETPMDVAAPSSILGFEAFRTDP
jgi:uncharacterized protein